MADDDILDFDQEIAAQPAKTVDPIPFRFHGEVFKAHGEGPGLTMLEFVRAAVENDGLAAVDSMLDFLQACMPEDEYARFRAICKDPVIVTPVEHLGIVVRGLMGKYGGPGRPTQPSSSSAAGSPSTADGSTDGSPENASSDPAPASTP